MMMATIAQMKMVFRVKMENKERLTARTKISTRTTKMMSTMKTTLMSSINTTMTIAMTSTKKMRTCWIKRGTMANMLNTTIFQLKNLQTLTTKMKLKLHQRIIKMMKVKVRILMRMTPMRTLPEEDVVAEAEAGGPAVDIVKQGEEGGADAQRV